VIFYLKCAAYKSTYLLTYLKGCCVVPTTCTHHFNWHFFPIKPGLANSPLINSTRGFTSQVACLMPSETH